jgi:hypothetical protein
MTRFLRASALGVLCTIGAIAVSDAQTVTCQNAQYNPEVLARFPNIAKACSDIISKDGEDYAVVKARLDRVDPSGRVAVRVKQADGSYSKLVSIRPRSDLRVLVDDKPARVSDLATGQMITAYVKVREPAIALAPADTNEQLVTTPLEEPQEQVAAALPATASMLPLFGMLGGVSLLLGSLLSVIRHRQK